MIAALAVDVARAVSADALREAWSRDVAAIDAAGAPHGVPSDWASLAGGAPSSRRIDTDAGAFVGGAIVVNLPVEAVWIAVQDGVHDTLPEDPLTVRWLPGDTPNRRDIYMSLDLPWPLKDRQWVAAMTSTTSLHAATEGRVWQRAWTLGDPGRAPATDPDAVWVEVNSGSWTLVDLGGETLAVFAARTVLGGSIPAWASQQWALGTLDAALVRIAERSRRMAVHYDAAHAVVYRPDATPLLPGLPR